MRYEDRESTYVAVGDDVESVEGKKRREKRKRSKAGRVRRRGINRLETLSEHKLTRECSASWWEERHARDKRGIRRGTEADYCRDYKQDIYILCRRYIWPGRQLRITLKMKEILFALYLVIAPPS